MRRGCNFIGPAMIADPRCGIEVSGRLGAVAEAIVRAATELGSSDVVVGGGAPVRVISTSTEAMTT